MRPLLLQITALTVMNLKSLPKRFWLSLSTVIAVTLVVVVLLAFLAMRNGFQHTLASAGAEDVAMILRAGSQSEVASVITRDQVRLIEEASGIAKSADGKPLVSAELYLVVDGIKHSSQTRANLPLRGIGQEGLAVRKGIHITAGRMFSPGSNEIVVGKALLSEFDGFVLGQTVTFGTSRWTVVGAFEAEGSVFESEIWADLPVVQSFFKRDNVFQTVRARLAGPAALADLQRYLDSDPRLKLEAKSEAAYFVDQASGTSDLIQKLGWPLAIAMAFGALAGALNTMYSSVAARTSEIATLRAIGFGGLPAFVSTLIESMVLAALGGVLGVTASFLVFNGLSASTLGASFTQIVFTFELTPALAAQGVFLAVLVGLIGGIFPSIRAARMPILAGLYGS
jgi:putative ABC transport system permease protein